MADKTELNDEEIDAIFDAALNDREFIRASQYMTNTKETRRLMARRVIAAERKRIAERLKALGEQDRDKPGHTRLYAGLFHAARLIEEE